MVSADAEEEKWKQTEDGGGVAGMGTRPQSASSLDSLQRLRNTEGVACRVYVRNPVLQRTKVVDFEYLPKKVRGGLWMACACLLL